MDSKLLRFDLSGHLEQREDGLWANFSHNFGFVNYGETPEEAIQKANSALQMVIDVFQERGDTGQLRNWLERKNVKYELKEIAEFAHSSSK